MTLRRAKFKQVCEPVQIHKQATIQTTLPLPLNNFSFLWSLFFFGINLIVVSSDPADKILLVAISNLGNSYLLQHLRKTKKKQDNT